ncbi:MAG: hypothetical protein OXN89_02885 [Bryobacterales bacterium]|nr:hypothetical protein [Bryobacterales bacterium]
MKPDIRACQDLQQGLGALFMCSDHGEYQRIRTPYLYPDGDIIDVFCKVEGDVVKVSDLAETTGWPRMQSASTFSPLGTTSITLQQGARP